MIARVTSWKELERWIPGGGASWEAAFPLVPIGDVMRVRRKVVSRQQFADYQPISIHFDGSIDLRDRTQPFKSSMFAALPGDLVYSKIDVRNGAIGLLPPEIKQAVVTSEYPVLVPDSKQVDVRYLALLLRSPNFQHLLKQAASGTSGRKRVHGDSFSELEIPLPEPTEQRQLLDGYEKALGKAAKLDADALALEQRAIREFEAALGLVPPPDLPRKPFQIVHSRNMDRWSHESALQNSLLPPTADNGLPTVTLGDYVEVTHGCGASPSPRRTGLEVLKISAATRGEFRPSEKKFAFDRSEFRRRYDLRRGDVLLCRVNGTLAYVGMSALVEDDMPNLIFPDKLIRVRVKDDALMPDFLWRLLQLPNMRAQIESYARTAVGNYAIGSSDIADFQIPLPKIKTQRELVKELREARRKAATKRTEAARLRSQAWADFLGTIFN
jgi:type I restriction enzyme S subunit